MKQSATTTQKSKNPVKQSMQMQQASEPMAACDHSALIMWKRLNDLHLSQTTKIAHIQRTIGNQSLRFNSTQQLGTLQRKCSCEHDTESTKEREECQAKRLRLFSEDKKSQQEMIGDNFVNLSGFIQRSVDAKVTNEFQTKPKEAKVCLVHLHADEENALTTAKKIRQTQKANLVYIDNPSKQRCIQIKLSDNKNRICTVDPNRIFTEVGLKGGKAFCKCQESDDQQKALEELEPFRLSLIKAIGKCRGGTGSDLTGPLPVMTFHNNTPKGNLSIDSYKKSGSEATATEQNQNKTSGKSNPFIANPNRKDDFFLVTKQEDFAGLTGAKQNVVLQSTLPKDDGSLSVALSDQRYLNIETGGKQANTATQSQNQAMAEEGLRQLCILIPRQDDKGILDKIHKFEQAKQIQFLTGKLDEKSLNEILVGIDTIIRNRIQQLNAMKPSSLPKLTNASNYRGFDRQPSDRKGTPQAKIIFEKFFLINTEWSLPSEFRGLEGKKKWLKDSSSKKLEIILQYSAIPGASRHHWGTEVDFNSTEDSYWEKGPGKNLDKWLKVNACRVGFVQTYTEGRIAGHAVERWHYSYMPIAQELHNMYNSKILQGKATSKEVYEPLLKYFVDESKKAGLKLPQDFEGAIKNVDVSKYVNSINTSP